MCLEDRWGESVVMSASAVYLIGLTSSGPTGMHSVWHHVGEGEEGAPHGPQLLLRGRECVHHPSGRRKLTALTLTLDEYK